MSEQSIPDQTAVQQLAAAVEAASVPASGSAHKPKVLMMVGMAGSGKTTLVQRLAAELAAQKKRVYTINLDPAVAQIPYFANIDIRDTITFKDVMTQFKLGPNGAIMTALNLFTTKFDQVMEYLEKSASEIDYIIVDTPGQIEVFTWSASGTIITEFLAHSYPTSLIYTVDLMRCLNATTFMSNMLMSCSILYKTQLPYIIAFNKADITSHEFAIEWMTDPDALSDALERDTTYMASYVRSMALVLEEFYEHLRCVGVSALVGSGMDEFFEALDESLVDYDTKYLPMLEELKAERLRNEEAKRQALLAKYQRDMAAERRKQRQAERNPWDSPHASDDEDEDDGDTFGMDSAIDPFAEHEEDSYDEDDFDIGGQYSDQFESSDEEDGEGGFLPTGATMSGAMGATGTPRRHEDTLAADLARLGLGPLNSSRSPGGDAASTSAYLQVLEGMSRSKVSDE